MSTSQSPAEDLQLLVWLPVHRQGDWLDACLLYGGGHEIETTQVSSAPQMAAQLRQYSFDLLVFWVEGTQGPSADLCQQLTELADQTGYLALGMHAAEGWQHALLEGGSVACMDMDAADPVALVHTVRRACELVSLRTQQKQWQLERQRLQQRDWRDVQRLLSGQRQLLSRLDQLGSGPGVIGQPFGLASDLEPTLQSDQQLLSTPLGHSYCTVLQSYVFDESQVSTAAMNLLAEHFLATGLPSSDIMRLHLSAVTRVTGHAGSGALRHCLASADRFLVELLMRLVDRRGQDLANSDLANSELAATLAGRADDLHTANVHPQSLPLTSPLAAA